MFPVSQPCAAPNTLFHMTILMLKPKIAQPQTSTIKVTRTIELRRLRGSPVNNLTLNV